MRPSRDVTLPSPAGITPGTSWSSRARVPSISTASSATPPRRDRAIRILVGGTVLRLEWQASASAAHPSTPGPGGTVRANEPTPTLTVECPGGTFVAPLRAARIGIGRAPDCELIIPSRVVSTYQATLYRGADGRYTVAADARARNPIMLRGQPTQSHLLASGDTLLIGSHEASEYMQLTYGAPRGVTVSTPIVQQSPSLGRDATIGRDPASTFCLPSPLVSWQHARLRRGVGGSHVIEDLGSTNGTYVNFVRLERAHRLSAGDAVQVGPYAFTYDGAHLSPQLATGPQVGLQVAALDLVRTTRGARNLLLDHVTLTAQPGQFVAIIGGNGAGKTTLLRALAGIQPAQHGAVLFDGVDSYHHASLFRGRIGYVPQADIVHLSLTVDEALYYTARLRLTRDLRDEEIEKRIQSVLATVDLSPHQHKLVGALSGGERKRLSLAVELLAEPQVLFLDEPNAALDPDHRRDLLRTIRALAEQGRTLVMVTHFREDFEACDRVAVMGRGGRLCFFGASPEALAHFGVDRFEDIYSCVEELGRADTWRKRYQRLPQYQRDVRALAVEQTVSDVSEAPRMSQGWQAAGQRSSLARQFGLLLDRYANILARDRINAAILLLQAPVIGVILAAVSPVGAFTSSSGPDDAETILFMLAIVAIWFGTSNSVREISKEVDIYQRERLAGLGIVPYLLSKVGILGLLCLLQTAVLLLIVTARTGLPPPSAGLFFSPLVELYIGCALAGLAGLSMGLCVSTFASNPDKAISAVPLVLLPQILLGGVIFNLSGPMRPLADVTISRWAVEALGTTTESRPSLLHATPGARGHTFTQPSRSEH